MKQLGRMQKKCNPSDVMLRKPLLDLFINIRYSSAWRGMISSGVLWSGPFCEPISPIFKMSAAGILFQISDMTPWGFLWDCHAGILLWICHRAFEHPVMSFAKPPCLR
jgi:hypothetical protein